MWILSQVILEFINIIESRLFTSNVVKKTEDYDIQLRN